MFASRKAKKYILRQIDNLTIDRLAIKKQKIENALEWFYAQGTFSKKQHDKLATTLLHKYNDLYEAWMKKLNEDCERDYMAKMKRFRHEV